MGYWRTLHLFDDRKFYNEVVPVLRGESGDLEAEYYEYLKVRTTGGINRIPQAEIAGMVAEGTKYLVDYFRPLADDFKRHSAYPRHEDLSAYLGRLGNDHEVGSFFEHYVFKTCADFFPQAAVGKYGVNNRLRIKSKSLACSIVDEIDRENILFCPYMMGIVNWLTHEDVALLSLDRENLVQEEESRSGDQILYLIDIAHRNNLGLIQGIDMREDLLARLPSHKLISAGRWENMEKQGLRFKL